MSETLALEAIKYRWTDKWALSLHCFVSTFSGLNKPARNIERQNWIKANQAIAEKRELSFVQLTEITESSEEIPAHWIYNRVEPGLAWSGVLPDSVAAPPGSESLDYPKNLVPSTQQPAASTFLLPPGPNTNSLTQDKLSSRWRIFYQNKPTSAAPADEIVIFVNPQLIIKRIAPIIDNSFPS